MGWKRLGNPREGNNCLIVFLGFSAIVALLIYLTT